MFLLKARTFVQLRTVARQRTRANYISEAQMAIKTLARIKLPALTFSPLKQQMIIIIRCKPVNLRAADTHRN